MKTNKAFPNSTFESQEAYFKFIDKYHVYGNEAYRLKKELDKKVSRTHKGSDDDFGRAKVTKREDQK